MAAGAQSLRDGRMPRTSSPVYGMPLISEDIEAIVPPPDDSARRQKSDFP